MLNSLVAKSLLLLAFAAPFNQKHVRVDGFAMKVEVSSVEERRGHGKSKDIFLERFPSPVDISQLSEFEGNFFNDGQKLKFTKQVVDLLEAENMWVGRLDAKSGNNNSENHETKGEAHLLYDKKSNLIVGSVSTSEAVYDLTMYPDRGTGEVFETSNENIEEGEDPIAFDSEGNPVNPFVRRNVRRNTATINGSLTPSYDEVLEDKKKKLKEHFKNSTRLDNLEQVQLSRNLQQGTIYIDIIIPYTKRAMCYLATGGQNTRSCPDNASNRNLIESRASLAVAQANLAMATAGIPNSQVQQRLIHTYMENDYDEYGLASNTIVSHLRNKGDGYMDNIHAKRNLYGGDLVSLFTYGSFAGQAVMGSHISLPEDGFSYSRIDHATSYYTHAHETGHCLGLLHDRNNAFISACPSTGCCYGYCWNFGYYDPNARFRSLMSYPYLESPRVLCFSTHLVLYNSGGTNYPIGNTENTNAREILLNYQNIASYKATVGPCSSSGVCDDGNPNNGQEYCSNHVCYGGGTIQTPSPPPPPPPECFSAGTVVQVKQKGQISIVDLEVGDRVLTSNGAYETVYAIDHRSRTTVARFLQIYLNGDNRNKSLDQKQPLIDDHDILKHLTQGTQLQHNGQKEVRDGPLEITHLHMVFVHGQKNPIPASALKDGDYLQTVVGPQQITKISSTTRKDGIFNPLTMDGTIVVNNGIIASVYSAHFKGLHSTEAIEIPSMVSGLYHAENYKDQEKTTIWATMSHQDFFQMATKPLKFFCVGLSLELCRLPTTISYGTSGGSSRYESKSTKVDSDGDKKLALGQAGAYLHKRYWVQQQNQYYKALFLCIIILALKIIDLAFFILTRSIIPTILMICIMNLLLSGRFKSNLFMKSIVISPSHLIFEERIKRGKF